MQTLFIFYEYDAKKCHYSLICYSFLKNGAIGFSIKYKLFVINFVVKTFGEPLLGS